MRIWLFAGCVASLCLSISCHRERPANVVPLRLVQVASETKTASVILDHRKDGTIIVLVPSDEDPKKAEKMTFKISPDADVSVFGKSGMVTVDYKSMPQNWTLEGRNLVGSAATITYSDGTVRSIAMATVCKEDYCPRKECKAKCGAKPCQCASK